ncbi:MAG: hypothetical protein DRP70_07445 [Spirochaetes bacterium]|nr:MAG: hypothetical protein DRP70_07445 [Spirochaetota bacterium]
MGLESIDEKRKPRIKGWWELLFSQERLQSAVSALIKNLSTLKIPATLISQYLPGSFDAVLAGSLDASPQALLKHKIRNVLSKYSRACGFN